MEKSREAFRTISEVSGLLDIPAHVLRFWESKFSQIKPVKRGGGRRYYRPDDINLLRGIRGLLYTDGLTIKGAQKLIKEQGVRHVIGLGMAQVEPPEALAATDEISRPGGRDTDAAMPDQPGLFEARDGTGEARAGQYKPAPATEGSPPAAAGPGVDRATLAKIIDRLISLRDSMRA